MNQDEIIEKLIGLKAEISKLDLEYLQLNMPIHLSEASKTLKPFTDLELTFERSIKTIKNKSIIEK